MQNVYIIVSCWLMVFMITCITVQSAEFINHLLMQNHSDCTDERGIDDDETTRIIQFWHLPQSVVSWLV